MKFTDEDLAKLKQDTRKIDDHGVSGHNPLTFREIYALIARLEAAEKVAQTAIECGVGKPMWDAWRKSKGGGE